MLDIAQLKAQIRAILLSLGRGATEREFRKEYYEIEGKSFNDVLRELGFNNAASFMSKIPDVCRLSKTFEGELFIQRVSSQETAHMDHLTVVKKRKRKSNRYAQRYMPARMATSNPYRSTYQNSAYRPPPPLRLSPAFFRTYPNVLRPVNSQNRAQYRPQPAPPKSQVKPALGIPLHLRHDVERVVYKKPEPTAAQSTPTPSQSSLGAEKVVYKKPEPTAVQPTPPSQSQSTLGAEKVVYKKTERVIFNGEEPQQVQVKQSSAWTDARSVVAEEYDSSISSDDGSSYTSYTGSIEDFENENDDAFDAVLKERKVSYDEASAAKITITVNNSQPTSRKTPFDIRNELSALRKRMSQMDLSKNKIQEFITSAEIQIPPPKLSANPMWFEIKILGIESPHKFTFQFDFPAIENLQDKMKEFYEPTAHSSTYLAKNLAINMIVAVSHSNKWYRAQVKAFDDIIAEIIPLDCMTLKPKKIARNSVFYLHKKFIEDTQKSGVGRVFGILPLGKEWCDAAKSEMANLTLERHQATVKIAKDNIYHLSIIANNTSRLRIIDIFIEKDLVKLEADCFNGVYMNKNMSLK